ncbi:DUF4267 domain-containing protein [Phytomonospora endophytica]|uniref:Putative membrane protein n=1 Tax=Phytomonospora endophytica TaxID=714109 RepID=A0A841G0B8_9ACTN|nr:DUF4267 domain-containing protein [Phytomonospora endophytica]MBB6037610.1 putative membrane protein [Phytomonospora endophytica]GIG67865.1 hypothetical protein Pen01_41600 [Phytomonospora endophytica]
MSRTATVPAAAAAAAVFSTTTDAGKTPAGSAKADTTGTARKPRRGLTITSHILAAAVGLFITYVGVTFFLMPTDTFTGFGVPASQVPVGEMTALLNVKGGRDIGLGLITFILLATRQTRALGWTLIAMSVMPFIDMTIVLSYEGSTAAALGIHGATALYVLVVGVFIAWNERTRKTTG